MFILSQNEKKLVNMDNVTSIIVVRIDGSHRLRAFYPGCDSSSGDFSFDDLGTYKTEERATEVLKAIAEYFSHSNKMPALFNMPSE